MRTEYWNGRCDKYVRLELIIIITLNCVKNVPMLFFLRGCGVNYCGSE